jgi:hypothetical protein
VPWQTSQTSKGGLLVERAQAAIVQPFLTRGIEEVLVKVHRKLGGRMARTELVAYLARHLGQGDIRIPARQFTTFAMLVRSGVSANWDTP